MNRRYTSSRGSVRATKKGNASDLAPCPVARTLSSVGPTTSQSSSQQSRPAAPRHRGCLDSPRNGTHASLYRRAKFGPHHSRMGERDVRQRLTTARRFCGHDSGCPRSVLVQSNARMRRASSLSPGKNSSPLRRGRIVAVHHGVPRQLGLLPVKGARGCNGLQCQPGSNQLPAVSAVAYARSERGAFPCGTESCENVHDSAIPNLAQDRRRKLRPMSRAPKAKAYTPSQSAIPPGLASGNDAIRTHSKSEAKPLRANSHSPRICLRSKTPEAISSTPVSSAQAPMM